MLNLYLLTGYRIYVVVRRLKYRKYACASSALYLQHPVSRYRRNRTYLLRSYLNLRKWNCDPGNRIIFESIVGYCPLPSARGPCCDLYAGDLENWLTPFEENCSPVSYGRFTA